jgi:type IX secretion system PorP/SprF family membrane protein
MKNLFQSTLALMLCFTTAIAQQEPQYSQNQFNSMLMINPAYGGSSGCPSVALRYRKQWTGFEGSPSTLSFIGETRVLSPRLGVGINLNHDVLGIDQATSIDGNIAYHLPVSEKGQFAVGIKGGASFLKSNFSKLSGVQPGDPLYGSSDAVTIPFVGLGLLYYTDVFYIGASSPRLVSFEQAGLRSTVAAPHFYLNAGYRIKVDEYIELRPAILAKYQDKAPLEFDFAMDAWYNNAFGVGVAYRTGDAVNLMLKGKYKKCFLGYSYDFNISGLKPFNNGSHEITFGIEFCNNRAPVDPTRNNNIRYF